MLLMLRTCESMTDTPLVGCLAEADRDIRVCIPRVLVAKTPSLADCAHANACRQFKVDVRFARRPGEDGDLRLPSQTACLRVLTCALA